MNALVIPSIREKNLLQFLEKWENIPLEIFVIEDNPTKQFKNLNKIAHHYSWAEISDILGDDAWIISKRDSAIRSFGFLMAYRSGADYIYTLDDDCAPANDSIKFCDDHQKAINNNTRWTESYQDQRTRGIPYNNKGSANVVLNMGLWYGHPDLDSVQTLSGVEKTWKHKHIPTRIMPIGQYFPLCGMNMCFKRELTPLMYFPLMGEGYLYRRFDDIWCGIIMKKVCDHLGSLVACGPPYIVHEKASDPFVNLIKEAPGIVANENFWQIIDEIELHGKNYIECMKEIGLGLDKPDNDHYFKTLGKAIVVWSNLF